MPRHLFDLAALMSLLLCTASAVLWVRSVTRNDALSFNAGRTWFGLNSEWRGVAQITVVSPSPYPDDGPRAVANPRVPTNWTYAEYVWRSAGFGFANRDTINGKPFWRVAVPYWLLVVLFATGPAVRLTALRRARRTARLGMCPACGYDLRATPDRCPECGTVPEAKAGPLEPAR